MAKRKKKKRKKIYKKQYLYRDYLALTATKTFFNNRFYNFLFVQILLKTKKILVNYNCNYITIIFFNWKYFILVTALTDVAAPHRIYLVVQLACPSNINLKKINSPDMKSACSGCLG